jgi:microcystin-dependent protein
MNMRWLIGLPLLLAVVAGSAYAARNGSGTYSVPNTASSGDVISSSDYNENFSDVGDEITNSLPRDGQAAMTGQFKSATGTVGAPGIVFSGDLDAGWYRIGADNWGLALAGANVVNAATTGVTITGDLTVSGTITGTSAASDTPSGLIAPYAGSSAPSGWLLAYGQCVSRATYAALFAVIGTTYDNACSGSEFGIPDLRGRVVAGQDDMGGSSGNRLTDLANGVNGDTLGDTGGDESFTLSVATMPSHSHDGETDSGGSHNHDFGNGGGTDSVENGSNATVADSATGSTSTDGSHTHDFETSTEGDGDPQPHVQPTIILNYIIKT